MSLQVRERAYLFVLICLAILLRFYQISFNSLWNDELTVWHVTQIRPFLAMLEYHLATDLNPPAYWILQYPFTFFLPQNEFGVRFLAAIFGVLTIPAVFYWAKSLFNSKVAWTASLLAVFSYQGIYFSQEARAYSMMVFFGTLTSWMWFEIFYYEHRAAHWKKVALLISCIALAYSHYFGTMMVGIQGLFAAYYAWKKKRWWDWFATYPLSGLMFLPWLPVIISQLRPINVWMSPPEFKDTYSYIKFLFEKSGMYAVLAPLLILFYLVQKFREQRWKDVEKVILIISFSLIPFIIAFIRSRLATPMLTHRYMLIALSAVHVLSALAFMNIVETIKDPRKQKLTLSLVLIFLVGLNVDTLFRRKKIYTELSKDLNREAGFEAAKKASETQSVLIYSGKNEAIASYYLPPSLPTDEARFFLKYDFSVDDLKAVLAVNPSRIVLLAASVPLPKGALEFVEEFYVCEKPVSFPRKSKFITCSLRTNL